MRANDRFLVAIVIGVVALVAVAFAVALSRPEPTYRSDDTPEAAVHNYLLALKLKDYPRAWGYLSPALSGYPPNAETFVHDFREEGWLAAFGNNEISVEGADVTGNLAVVEVRRTNFYNNDLFDSGLSSSIFNVEVQREDGVWKLINSGEFWWVCWDEWDELREDCKRKRGALATPEKRAP